MGERPCRPCQDADHDRCLELEWIPEFNENRCCCDDLDRGGEGDG